MRFSVEEKRFKFEKEWVEEDEKMASVERTVRELSKAMNSISEDLKFTFETEYDFPKKRLPTLAFELWSTKEGIRFSYFEKEMRNQVLTQKRSSMSENAKVSILTNELNRRFEMVDDKIEKEEKTDIVNHFTQQLVNSGYAWPQIREIVTSSLKGICKKDLRRKETNSKKFRTGEESLIAGIKKKLTENTEWYKSYEEEDGEIDNGETLESNEIKAWKQWRRGGRGKRTSKRERTYATTDQIQGVLFIAHTEKSELAKRVREKLQNFEEISRIKMKVVERVGSKIVDLIHKSNPWENQRCDRKDCELCSGADEKQWGRCKKRSLVYEHECISCKKDERKEESPPNMVGERDTE